MRFLSILLSLLLIFVGANAQNKNVPNTPPTTVGAPSDKIDYTQMGAPMPKLLLETLDSIKTEFKKGGWLSRKKAVPSAYSPKILSDKDFSYDGPLVVMMFNPTCGHCQEETIEMQKNIHIFKNTKVVLMANKVMRPYLPTFIKDYNLANSSTFFVGIDSLDFIKETFLYQMLPQVNVYNKQRKLVRTFTGGVSMDTLAKYLDN